MAVTLTLVHFPGGPGGPILPGGPCLPGGPGGPKITVLGFGTLIVNIFSSLSKCKIIMVTKINKQTTKKRLQKEVSKILSFYHPFWKKRGRPLSVT